MRFTDSQDWIVNSFVPSEIDAGEKRRNQNNVSLATRLQIPSSFEHILPTLLAPEIGGGNPFN